jgi:hypothetical protein
MLIHPDLMVIIIVRRKKIHILFFKRLFFLFVWLANFNNMRLPSADGWYPGYYFYGYPFPPFFNNAQHCGRMSIMMKLFFMIFTCIISIRIL